MESRQPRLREHRTRALLLQLLEAACGTREAALSVLRLALVRAGLDGVPDRPDDTVLFVRAHLLARLSEDVGPRLAMALVDDLVERLDAPPESGVIAVPPSSAAHRVVRVSVRSSTQPVRGILLIVDKDAFRRASLARFLVPARWNVRTASSHEDLVGVASEREDPVAIVVAVDHPSMESIVRAAVESWPGAAVVLHGDVSPASAPLLASLRQRRQVRLCLPDEPLLERIDTLLEQLRQG
ncbi:MAG: hypothetical protein ACRENE_07045 [Polyangiaceae bacterium]